jgi:predicted nucleic acid-binding Zn ribbon protein
MTRWSDDIDDEFDGDEHEPRNEDPDPSDQDQDVFDNTSPCPHCNRPIYEESEFCPHCGKYVTEEDQTKVKTSTWIIIGVVLAIAAMTVWMKT